MHGTSARSSSRLPEGGRETQVAATRKPVTRRRSTDFSQEAWRMVRALSVELVRSAAELGSARATFQGVELQAMRLNGQVLLGGAPTRVHLCLWRGQQPIDSTVTAVHVASIEPALETASEVDDDG